MVLLDLNSKYWYTIDTMKQGIHPVWYKMVNVNCACGNKFTAGSTLSNVRVEICSKCHPFFTGTQKFVDTLGQVQRYSKKVEHYQEKALKKQQERELRTKKVTDIKSDKPTLKDLLMQARKDLHS